MSKKKSNKLVSAIKLSFAVVTLSGLISHFPVLPHYAADAIVWTADTVTGAANSALAMAIGDRRNDNKSL